jgi:flagellar biosynthetic protein FliR
MDPASALLRDLPGLAFGLILVIARVGTAMLAGPGLGESEIPATVRAALAGLVALLVLPLLRTQLPPVPTTVAGLVGMLALEIVIGAWLGFITRVLVLALSIAADIISYMVGWSNVLQLDPSLGAQVPAVQRMFSLAAVALLFTTGLYLLPLRAIIGSYALIPVGSGFDSGGAAQLLIRALGESFGLALRLAAPFIITALVWHAGMGFVARLEQSIPVQMVAAPAQILAGIVLLLATIAILFSSWSAAMLQSFSVLPGL